MKIGMIVATVAVLSYGMAGAAPRQAGPHGGRVVEARGMHFEFWVDTAGRPRLYQLDQDHKATAITVVQATLRAELKGATKTMQLVSSTLSATPAADAGPAHLVGSTAMPTPAPYRVALSIRTGKAKAVNIRFEYDEHVCGGCNHSEYACTCGH